MNAGSPPSVIEIPGYPPKFAEYFISTYSIRLTILSMIEMDFRTV